MPWRSGSAAAAATVAHPTDAERTSAASDAEREIAAEDDVDVLASTPPGTPTGHPASVSPSLDYRDEAAVGLLTDGRVRTVRQRRRRNQQYGRRGAVKNRGGKAHAPAGTRDARWEESSPHGRVAGAATPHAMRKGAGRTPSTGAPNIRTERARRAPLSGGPHARTEWGRRVPSSGTPLPG